MKFRIGFIIGMLALGLILAFTFFATPANAQSDNTVHVKTFPGSDVGTKVTNAMATCAGIAGTITPCILVIDASLAAFPAGTMPTLCSNCYLADYRTGLPQGTLVGAVYLADSYSGATCDAKIHAADLAIGSASGVIQIGPNCGSTIAATSISANHMLQFLASASGTYTLSGGVTLAQNASIWGPPMASNGSAIILKEANGANLAFVVSMSGGSTIMGVTLDGNQANQSTALDTVLIDNANRVHIYDATIRNATRDNIHVTNTRYPAPTASETLTVSTILTINTTQGAQNLFNVTTAGTGTSSYPSCTNVLSSTCSWGTATLTNIGATQDNVSGSGYLGPDVLINGSGRDAFFGERIADWIIGTQVEFQTAGRDGLHCEDCSSFNISGANLGANTRYGLYKSVVNSLCSAGELSISWTLTGSQFANNGAGDIYENGSSESGPNFCTVGSAEPFAGGDSIVDNEFENPTGTGVNSITLIDAPSVAIVGNAFGGLYFQTAYQYLVASSFSTLTGTNRLPSTIEGNTIQPFSYSEATPFSLASGVDVACYTSAQGTEKCSQAETLTSPLTDAVIYGGSANNSTLVLHGTSNGSPSGSAVIVNPNGEGNLLLNTSTNCPGSGMIKLCVNGTIEGYGIGNWSGTVTAAAGAAAGTSPTVACAGSIVCGWNGGSVNLLTGTSPSTGILLTVTDSVNHPYQPTCSYHVFPASSSYVPNGPEITGNFYPTDQSTTVHTLNASSALSASSYYKVNYTCIGL